MTTKNERRRQARERAREARESARRREHRAKFLIRSGIVIAVVGVATVVALAVATSVRPPGPGPRNMAGDGVRISTGLHAERSPARAVDAPPVSPPTTPTTPGKGEPLEIRVYLDFLCPACGAFEKTNGDYLERLARSGRAVIDYHALSILDQASARSRYSTRSAAAAACVADLEPDSFFVAVRALFGAQPAEGTTGPDNRALASTLVGATAVIDDSGAAHASRLTTCIVDGTFTDWVGASTERALRGPLPGTDVERVTATPTVVIDGTIFAPGDGSLESRLVDRYGESFSMAALTS